MFVNKFLLLKRKVMKTNQTTLIIDKPSPKLMEIVKDLERRKKETRKELRDKKDFFFPSKDRE